MGSGYHCVLISLWSWALQVCMEAVCCPALVGPPDNIPRQLVRERVVSQKQAHPGRMPCRRLASCSLILGVPSLSACPVACSVVNDLASSTLSNFTTPLGAGPQTLLHLREAVEARLAGAFSTQTTALAIAIHSPSGKIL